MEQLGAGPMASMNQSKQFDRLDQVRQADGSAADQVQGSGAVPGDLEDSDGPPFLFDVRTDYVKVTNDTVLVP
jgi:hypothetical protein